MDYTALYPRRQNCSISPTDFKSTTEGNRNSIERVTSDRTTKIYCTGHRSKHKNILYSYLSSHKNAK
jgi:hypothetical protein